MTTAFQPTACPPPVQPHAEQVATTFPQERRNTLKRNRSLAAVFVVLGVAAVALTAWTGLAGASSKKASLSGAGSTFVAPLVAPWTAHYNGADINYSAHRQRRRHRRDHGPDGRLRGERRPADARPVRRLQGLRPDPVGLLGHLDPLQRQRRRLRPQADRPDHRRHLPRQDQEVERQAHPRDQQGRQAARTRSIVPICRSDGSGTSYNFTDYLSQVSKAVQDADRQGHAADLPGRRRREGQLGRRRQARTRRRAASPTSTSPTRTRTTSRSRRSGTAPGSSSSRASSRSRPRRTRSRRCRNGQRDLGRRPAQEAARRLPDLHVHLGDRAAADVARQRT